MRAFLVAVWRFLHYKLTHVTEEKWRVLTICLMLSGSLWFLRQMNKTYTTGMKVRLSFEYDKGRFVPLQPLPDALWINVTAEGWPLALAAYGPGRARLVVRPALEKGFWIADADKVKRNLQPRMPRVQINYLQDIPQPYLFDSLMRRQVPIEVRLPSGRAGRALLCYQGLSRRLDSLPRLRILTEEPADTVSFTMPVHTLYGDKWDANWCEPEVRVEL